MICLVSISAHTQVGISMGPIVQHGFGTKKVFGGLNLGVEIPRNENSSFIARIYGTLKTTYQDSTYAEAKAGVTPSVLMVDMKNGVSTYGIEGGIHPVNKQRIKAKNQFQSTSCWLMTPLSTMKQSSTSCRTS